MGKKYIYNKIYDHTYGFTMDDLNRQYDIHKPSYNFWINLRNIRRRLLEDVNG